MSYDGNHSGIAEEERIVPLWIINNKSEIQLNSFINQIDIAEIMKKFWYKLV